MKQLALLRGINVSGKKKIKMADLRAMLDQHGFTGVATYIQSGNIVFAEKGPPVEVARELREIIRSHYGFDVPTMVFTAAEWLQFQRNNPFLVKGGVEEAHLHLTILAKAPSEILHPEVQTKDEYHLQGRAIYLHCPNGYGRTKLTNAFWEKVSGMEATTRNWKSVKKLATLLVE